MNEGKNYGEAVQSAARMSGAVAARVGYAEQDRDVAEAIKRQGKGELVPPGIRQIQEHLYKEQQVTKELFGKLEDRLATVLLPADDCRKSCATEDAMQVPPSELAERLAERVYQQRAINAALSDLCSRVTL